MRVKAVNNGEGKAVIRSLRIPLLSLVMVSAFPAWGFSPVAEPTCAPLSGSEAGYIFRVVALPQGSDIRYLRYSSAALEAGNAESFAVTATLANCDSRRAVAFDVLEEQAGVDQVGLRQLFEQIGESPDEAITMRAKALGFVVRSETIADDACVCALLREGKLATKY